MSAPVGDPSHATEVVRELSGSTIGHKDQGPPGPLVFDLMDCPLSSPRHAYPCHTSNTRPWLHQSDQTMGTQDFPWQQRRPRKVRLGVIAGAPYPRPESQSISDRSRSYPRDAHRGSAWTIGWVFDLPWMPWNSICRCLLRNGPDLGLARAPYPPPEPQSISDRSRSDPRDAHSGSPWTIGW